MDGDSRSFFVSSNLFSPTGLTVDYQGECYPLDMKILTNWFVILNQNPILRRVSKVAPMLSIILFIFQVISYTGLIATWIQSIILVWTAPTEWNWPMILVQILCILQYLDPICTTLLWTGSKIYNTFLSEKIPSRIYFFYFTLHVINLCQKM